MKLLKRRRCVEFQAHMCKCISVSEREKKVSLHVFAGVFFPCVCVDNLPAVEQLARQFCQHILQQHFALCLSRRTHARSSLMLLTFSLQKSCNRTQISQKNLCSNKNLLFAFFTARRSNTCTKSRPQIFFREKK